jgi:choice-of-anchor B domain-containing protein
MFRLGLDRSGEHITFAHVQTMNRITHGLSIVAAAALLVAAGLLASAAPLAAQGAFGRSVEIDGDQILVLKPTAGRGAAAVYVYEMGPDGWTEVQRLGTDVTTATGEGLGPGLVSRDGLALVASADPDVRHAAHVFRRGADGTWSAVEPIPMDPAAGVADAAAPQLDFEGLIRILAPPQRTLATDGDRVLVGSLQNQGAGTAQLMERDDETGDWRIVEELVPSSGDLSGGYGSALLLTPGRAFVGAPRQDDGAGAVYVYEAGEEGWTETARIDGEILGDVRRVGTALGLHGDVLILGAPGAGDDTGQAIMLRRNQDGTWEEIGRLGAPGSDEEQARNGFGASIDVSSGGIWIGAPGGDAVHRFEYIESGSGENWPGQPPPAEVDVTGALGASVAAGDDLVVAGAPAADGSVGRVVVYERPESGVTWSATVIEPAGALETITGGEVPCTDGEAAGFSCENVDLLSFLTIEALGGAPGEGVSDIWGWTDRETGVEYALVGRSGGLVIVDISRSDSPVLVATVPANPSGARDIKTYEDHAFFTGDGAGQHGLVVVDLTRLRDVAPADMPATFEPDAVYDGMASAHNLAIDTESGFAYVVRPSGGGETCGAGLHMVDIRTPTEPTFAGCYTDDQGVISAGSSHDTQCVVYRGPDEEYAGRQVCFASNEGVLRIVDVTDKANPMPISAASYPGQAYIHQGWLTEDQAWFYLDDELDELVGTTETTRTLVWDLTDLDDPTFAGELLGPDGASDHNLFIKGDRMYQANYQAGLRVVDISEPTQPVEVGYFDTTPYGDNPPGFNGAWTAYPFFDSGAVIVSSMNEGLFVLRPVRPLVP